MKKHTAIILLLITVSLRLSKPDQELFIETVKGEPCRNTSCETLSSVNISSSTTLLFLEGIHLMNNVSWTGLDNITLRAYQEANVTIKCELQSKLQFRDITNLRIEGIIFSNCGAPNNPPGILLSNLTNGYFHNVQFTASYSGALQVMDSLVHFANLTINKNILKSKDIKKTFSALNLVNTRALLTGTTTIAENEILYENEIELNCGEGDYRYRDTDYVTVLASNSAINISGILIVRENISPSGIINFENSTIETTGLSVFEQNAVCIEGALSLIENSNAFLSGEIKFLNNNASNEYFAGILPVGGLSMRDSSLHVKGEVEFSGNRGDVATIESYTSNISIHGRLICRENFADYSGTMLRSKTNMTVIGKTMIKDNTLNNAALRLEASNFTSYGKAHFLRNKNYSPCRGIERSNFYFHNFTVFQNNSGIASLRDSAMTFDGNSTFRENNVQDFTPGGGIFLKGRSKLKLSGFYTFERNRFSDKDGGAIYSDKGEILFEGHGKFIENAARRGGAIYLQNNPRMKLGPGAKLNFTGNSATKGGAIYLYTTVERIHCIMATDNEQSSECFVDLHTNKNNHTVIFRDNNSTKGASILHIKFVENIDLGDQRINSTVLNALTQLNYTGNSLPIIASDSFQLCFCINNESNCTIKEKKFHVSRGEKILVGVRALTLIPTKNVHLRSYFQSSAHSRDQSLDGDVHHLDEGCTNLIYRAKSTASEEYVTICADESCEEATDAKLMLHIVFEDCPLGFTLNKNKTECICDDKKLRNKTDMCNIDTKKITKTYQNFWIGKNTTELAKDIILYSVCPLDYCLPIRVDVDPSNPNTQCTNRRSGVLCGGCIGNTSLALGSSSCIECSHSFYLFLIIPFMILGVLLVTLIFITQLTISNGTIHGLILYASVVNANATTFRLKDLKAVNVIIMWLNLNFGIETCFYQGLDQLEYTAWQFVFPLYLWILVATVIVICHYSVRASRFFSTSNPVEVLATVIFLAYTKILQNIIVILTEIKRDYPPNDPQPVWKYDGNVVFGQKGHGVLIAVGVFILVFLFIPYTVVLIGSQVLEKNKHISKLLNCLRLVPFIRAYQAPYKPESRYWVGLCQLLKCIILIAIATGDHKNAGLLATSSSCIFLLSIIGASGGIYTERWLNILEISHILNLGIFTSITYHLNLSYQPNERKNCTIVIGYISITVAIAIFIGTVIKQCLHRLNKTRWHTRRRNKIIRKKSMTEEREEMEMMESNATHKKLSMVTSQELKFSGNHLFSELREPMLDH